MKVVITSSTYTMPHTLHKNNPVSESAKLEVQIIVETTGHGNYNNLKSEGFSSTVA